MFPAKAITYMIYHPIAVFLPIIPHMFGQVAVFVQLTFVRYRRKDRLWMPQGIAN